MVRRREILAAGKKFVNCQWPHRDRRGLNRSIEKVFRQTERKAIEEGLEDERDETVTHFEVLEASR